MKLILAILLALLHPAHAGVDNPPGVTRMGAVGSTPSANGASISGKTLTLQPADATHPGVVTSGTQTLGGGKTISLTGSNSEPGTTDALTILNPSGNMSHLVYKFGSTIRASIDADNSGVLAYKATGDSGHTFYTGGTLGSQTLMAQLVSVGLFSYGGTFTQGNVTAGSQDDAPPGTLNAFGSFAIKGKNVTADYTATASEAVLWCDTATANVCSGSATYACSHFTDSSSCQSGAYGTLGCHFTVAGSCSDGNNTSQGTCEGLNAACDYASASCSIYNGDMMTCASTPGCSANGPSDCVFLDEGACTAQNSHGCSTNFSSCSAFSSDYSACTGHTGCTPTTSDCSTYNFNSTACGGAPGCSYNFGDDTCSGTYITNCTGNYFSGCTGTYQYCSGTYFTGTCNGGSFGTCGGTTTCDNLTPTDSGTCTSTGCSWTPGLTVTLPQLTTTNVHDNTGWLLRIANISGGVVKVKPTAPDTIEGGSLETLGSQWDKVTVHPRLVKAACDAFTNNMTACNSHSGCTFSPLNCEGYAGVDSCPSGCTWTGVSCTGPYGGSDGGCFGNYTVSSTWLKW